MTPVEQAVSIVASAVGPRGGEVDTKSDVMTTRGGDSIAHVSILMEIERQTCSSLPAVALAKLTSVTAIADFLTEHTNSDGSST